MDRPGHIVRAECWAPLGLSVTAATALLGVDRQKLSNLLKGRSGGALEMALRLERAFGRSARDWMERQMEYELADIMARADEIDVQRYAKGAQ